MKKKKKNEVLNAVDVEAFVSTRTIRGDIWGVQISEKKHKIELIQSINSTMQVLLFF